MFTLKLYDRKGQELKEGDIVKISDGHRFNFYAEVKYLEKEETITPFHTFTFQSFEKVNELPAGVVQSTEERYKIWYPEGDPEEDTESEKYPQYLADWRACERFLEKSVFRIEKS